MTLKDRLKATIGGGWRRATAISFIKRLDKHLSPKYNVAFVGSVLQKGYSAKDLDIIIFPHSTEDCNLEEAKSLLVSFGLTERISRETLQGYWRRMGSHDCKHVEVWRVERTGKRVDIFFPWFEEK